MSKKLVLIDALNLVRRIFAIEHNYESIESLNNTAQRVSSATQKILKLTSATHALAVFDGAVSWRFHYYELYKSTRKPMPTLLSNNMRIIEQAFESEGVAVYRPEQDEADDIIATLATKASNALVDVAIISTDKGFLPHINNKIQVYDYFKKQWLDLAHINEKFLVQQEQLVELWAMAGDKTNDIPGIKGIGLKTAQRLLNEHGNFEEIINDDTLKAAHKKKLIDGVDNFVLSKNLVSLRTDIHLGFNLQSLRLAC